MFCFSGEDLVPESPRQGQTSPGGRAGEAEDGVVVPASPSSPLPAPGVAGVFRSGRPPPGIAIRGASPDAADWPHTPGAATPPAVTARAHALTQSPYVLIKTSTYLPIRVYAEDESICCESCAFTFTRKTVAKSIGGFALCLTS